MNKKQVEVLEKVEHATCTAENSKNLCALIVDCVQAEEPTEAEAISAYKDIRVLVLTLYEDLTQGHEQLITAGNELLELLEK